MPSLLLALLVAASPWQKPQFIEGDRAYGVALAPDGSVAIAGTGYVGDDRGVFVARYTASGERSWAVLVFDAERGREEEHHRALAIDSAGAVYLAISTEGALANDALLVKLDAAGKEVWRRTIASVPEDAPDEGNAVAIAPDGAIVFVGTTRGRVDGKALAKPRKADAFVARFDPSGKQLWIRQFGSPEGEEVESVAIDAKGRIVVLGTTKGTMEGKHRPRDGADYFLAAFDSAGAPVWTRQAGGTRYTAAQDLAIDGSGALWVAGWNTGDLDGLQHAGGEEDMYGTARDGFVSRWSPDGKRQWTRAIATDTSDQLWGVAAGEADAVVVGSSRGSVDGRPIHDDDDAVVARFDAEGTAAWVRRLGGRGGDRAYGLARRGDLLIVVGRTDGSLTDPKPPKDPADRVFVVPVPPGGPPLPPGGE